MTQRIDPLAPDFCLLSELLDRLPHRPSPAVVWRWMHKGVRGRKLQVLKFSGRNHTTETEFRAFVQDIQQNQPPQNTDAVDEQLAAAGYV